MPAQGQWETLFDGKSLAGWKAAEHPDSIKVVDGMIYCDGPRAHLFYLGADGRAEFENFELELEGKPMAGCNSGVYFHATWQDANWPRKSGFEVQVNNTQPPFDRGYSENKKTGSLYGVRNLYKAMVRDGEWFTLNIVVRKPRVEVRLNGKLVMEYTEPSNQPVLNPGTTMDFLTKGTIALQCHDEKSQIYYRNIRLRRLPPGEDATVVKPVLTEQDLQRAVLAKDNFPLVNLRTYPGDRLGLGQLRALHNRTGIFAGLIHQVSKGGRVHDDATALAAVAALKDEPVFAGLDVSLDVYPESPRVSLETEAKFDYLLARSIPKIIAGGFTGTPEEENRRMEAQVAEVVRKIETLPIDVYADVMRMPELIKAPAEEMWTEERMQRVIAAAAKNGVALEINLRERTPTESFLKLAKAAGVRFTAGSDPTDAGNLSDWSYLLEMQKKLALGWKNMWVPGHEPSRAQRALLKP